jgi:hypothetical protein
MLFVGVLGAQAAAATGALTGCVRDTFGHGLPGATVLARGGGVQRSAVADATGCFELKDLPVATYRVIARLTGFDNVTTERVVVEPATATRLDVTTRISAICECVRIAGDLAGLRERADAVLHVRLTHSEAASAPSGYYRHTATVLNTVKRAGDRVAREASIVVLQNQRSGTPDPYDVGQEFVVFLVSSGPNAFLIVNDDPGLAVGDGDYPAIVFLIEDGRVQRGPSEFSRQLGLRIDPFLAILRALRPGK